MPHCAITGILAALEQNARERTALWEASEKEGAPNAEERIEALTAEAEQLIAQLDHKNVRSAPEAIRVAQAMARHVYGVEGRILRRALEYAGSQIRHISEVQ